MTTPSWRTLANSLCKRASKIISAAFTPTVKAEAALILCMSALLSSCGMLTRVPDALINYPTDFAQFLSETNSYKDYDDLVYFLAYHDVDNVVPAWQLLQQGSDWSKHQQSKYAIPPRGMWTEMIDTLAFLKFDLVPHIGPVKVLSGFRTPDYNNVAGGANKSRHMTFSALDLRPTNKIDPSQLHGILQNQWSNHGQHYKLGLGLYHNQRFHIDTGGHRKW